MWVDSMKLLAHIVLQLHQKLWLSVWACIKVTASCPALHDWSHKSTHYCERNFPVTLKDKVYKDAMKFLDDLYTN